MWKIIQLETKKITDRFFAYGKIVLSGMFLSGLIFLLFSGISTHHIDVSTLPRFLIALFLFGLSLIYATLTFFVLTLKFRSPVVWVRPAPSRKPSQPKPKPILEAKIEPKHDLLERQSLSVILLAYNEARILKSSIKALDLIVRSVADDYEIILIDDGSVDETHTFLSGLNSQYDKLRIIRNSTSLGYGPALSLGFETATKDLIFYTTPNFKYDLRQIRDLVRCMQPGVDAVCGYRVDSPNSKVTIESKLFSLLVRIIYGIKIRDVDCNFRLLRRSSCGHIRLHANGVMVSVEMVKAFQGMGLSLAQIPVTFFDEYVTTIHSFTRIRALTEHLRCLLRERVENLEDLAGLWWRLLFRPYALIRYQVEGISRVHSTDNLPHMIGKEKVEKPEF